jgi:AcrR family transcriptional regulator
VSATEIPGRPGRPRRYHEAEELERLLDAAFEVIRAKGYQAVTVADILAEAQLSTRSFYRHFASKDELLHAMFRRDAEQFAAAVTRRVETAPDPASALVSWIDDILAFGYNRPRAKRAAVLGSPDAARSLAPEDMANALHLLVIPLAAVLRAGQEDGSFATTDPEADAYLISAIAWDTSGRIGEASTKAAKDAIRGRSLAFVNRALGVP